MGTAAKTATCLQGAGLAAGAVGAGAAGGLAASHAGDHGTTGFQVGNTRWALAALEESQALFPESTHTNPKPFSCHFMADHGT
jgi:hypothetical protein